LNNIGFNEKQQKILIDRCLLRSYYQKRLKNIPACII